MTKTVLVFLILCYLASDTRQAADTRLQEVSPAPQMSPVRVVEMNVGEITQLELSNGQSVQRQTPRSAGRLPDCGSR
jgi:hypothetical protein